MEISGLRRYKPLRDESVFKTNKFHSARVDAFVDLGLDLLWF